MPEKDQNTEVRGALHFEHGNGYFITPPTINQNAKDRVALWISENKVIVRQLSELSGKWVRAQGPLKVMTEGSWVPEGGKYFSHFDIEATEVTEKEALLIARYATQSMKIPADVRPACRRKGAMWAVTFPMVLPPHTLGPDYHAQVEIDAQTGKVVRVLVGS